MLLQKPRGVGYVKMQGVNWVLPVCHVTQGKDRQDKNKNWMNFKSEWDRAGKEKTRAAFKPICG